VFMATAFDLADPDACHRLEHVERDLVLDIEPVPLDIASIIKDGNVAPIPTPRSSIAGKIVVTYVPPSGATARATRAANASEPRARVFIVPSFYFLSISAKTSRATRNESTPAGTPQ